MQLLVVLSEASGLRDNAQVEGLLTKKFHSIMKSFYLMINYQCKFSNKNMEEIKNVREFH